MELHETSQTRAERPLHTGTASTEVPTVHPSEEAVLQDLADEITDALGQAVQKIIDVGRLLLKARNATKHGAWERMFKGHPQAVERPLRFSVEVARMWMKIAGHAALSNGNYSSLLPVSWRTLHELTFLPEADLLHLLATGGITPETTQAEVVALRLGQPTPVKQRPLPVQEGHIHAQETVDITLLKCHPRNYKEHPDDQLAHIMQSLKDHGFYRPIVVAHDNTILAGHGVVEAATKMGIATVPVVRLDLDPDEPLATKVLTGDNEIGNLAIKDCTLKVSVLQEVLSRGDLKGTGFDEMQLSALHMLTRLPKVLIPKNEMAEWEAMGMPAHEHGATSMRLMIQFRNEEDRERYVKDHDVTVTRRWATNVWSAWWPPQGPDGQVVEWVGGEAS